MLSGEQKKKLKSDQKWGKAQQRADFNKRMGRKLRDGLKEMSDLVLLLNSLPPRVLENINLAEHLPDVITFVDTFLEKVAPLPVETHAYGDPRVFQTTALKIDKNHDAANGQELKYMAIFNGERYLIKSYTWQASATEITTSYILKNHARRIQKYIDPRIVTVIDVPLLLSKSTGEMYDRGLELRTVDPDRGIPTDPPSQPYIIDETEIRPVKYDVISEVHLDNKVE